MLNHWQLSPPFFFLPQRSLFRPGTMRYTSNVYPYPNRQGEDQHVKDAGNISMSAYHHVACPSDMEDLVEQLLLVLSFPGHGFDSSLLLDMPRVSPIFDPFLMPYGPRAGIRWQTSPMVSKGRAFMLVFMIVNARLVSSPSALPSRLWWVSGRSTIRGSWIVICQWEALCVHNSMGSWWVFPCRSLCNYLHYSGIVTSSEWIRHLSILTDFLWLQSHSQNKCL